MSELLGILHIEELRYAQKKLYTYNVQDGDDFLIESKWANAQYYLASHKTFT